MTDRGKHKPATEFLKVPITSMDGRAIEECLNMLNPTITVEAKGELISMIRELGQLRIMVEMAKNMERRRGYEDGPIAFPYPIDELHGPTGKA